MVNSPIPDTKRNNINLKCMSKFYKESKIHNKLDEDQSQAAEEQYHYNSHEIITTIPKL